MGYTHGDLKFQNICYNESTRTYTIIDFALVTKIFKPEGEHKEQENVKSFFGNSLFAPDSMVALTSTGRKDDIESFLYVICFLHHGVLPVVKFINDNIDVFNMNQFLDKILEFRVQNKELCHQKIKETLPKQLVPAFTYILSLNHSDKPNYNLIKLWMATDEEDEKNVFET